MYKREELYKMYIADSLYNQGQNKRITVRYTDIANGTLPKKDERTGDEIVEDFIAKFNLKVRGGSNGLA